MVYRQSSSPAGNIPPNYDYFNGQLDADDIEVL